MGEIEIGLLLERRVVGADDCGEGFDIKEEVFVEFGYLGSMGGHDGWGVVCTKIEVTGGVFSNYHIRSGDDFSDEVLEVLDLDQP